MDETDDLPAKRAYGHARFKTNKLCRPHSSGLNLAVASGEVTTMSAPDVEHSGGSATLNNSSATGADGALLYDSMS